MKATLQYSLLLILLALLLIIGHGCANIIPPGGGPRDSIPPVLVSATPPDSSRSVNPSRIMLTFDEYIDQLQNTNDNVIISPTLSTTPSIDSRLRTVTIRISDTLEPNTTYSISFGDAIRDVNEGNILKDFTYIFSTGATIDENTFSGKVLLAETGKVDSSLIVVLHRDLSDSAIIKQRPRYYTRLDGEGNFVFRNLPAGQFNIFVVENDFTKQYTDSTRMFAFLNKPVTISKSTDAVVLYAYQQAKPRPPATGTTATTGGGGRNQDRRLRYTNNESAGKDVLAPLHIDFNRRLKTFDSTKIVLTDTSFNRLPGFRVHLDSNRTKVSVHYPWQLDSKYKLIIQKDAVGDNDGVTLLKTDTLTIATRQAEDYGSLRIRFNNLDLTRNPVLQVVQNDRVVDSLSLAGREFSRAIMRPGDYELRILYDDNRNGTWDPGNYALKKQPEIVLALTRKITVKSRWENEEEINLVSGQ